MAKENPKDRRYEKAGYRPLNEGYTPKEQKGYSPKGGQTSLPKAPVGGTGQTSGTGKVSEKK